VRAEGALDKETGLLHAVAEVRDPYAVKTGQAPLMPGLFVNAEIVGRDQSGVFVLPSRAVNASYEVLWVDRDDRLQPNDRPATSGFIRTCKGSMTNQTRGKPSAKTANKSYFGSPARRDLSGTSAAPYTWTSYTTSYVWSPNAYRRMGTGLQQCVVSNHERCGGWSVDKSSINRLSKSAFRQCIPLPACYPVKINNRVMSL
jgi:hypothetical protein